MENFREGAESAEREELLRLLRNPGLRELAKLEISRYESDEAQRRRQEAIDERTARRNLIAERLDPNLTLGEPAGNYQTLRGQEVLGVYYNGQFIENISNGDPIRVMSDTEISSELNRIYIGLSKSGSIRQSPTGHKIEASETRVEIVMNEETQRALESQGVTLDLENQKLHLSRGRDYRIIDLYDNGANKEVSFDKKDDNTVVLTVTEKNGRVISYALTDGQFRISTRKILQNPNK